MAPSRDQRGLAPASSLALLSAAAVAVAGVGLLFAGGGQPADVAKPVTATPSTTVTSSPPSPKPHAKPAHDKGKKAKKPAKPAVRRAATYVEVYNNSGISGLAGRTASRISGAGWQVVGSDNWYGTIPATTVYFPPRLERAAHLLAKDLGIARLRPSIAPMRGDRLTVILTSDFS